MNLSALRARLARLAEDEKNPTRDEARRAVERIDKARGERPREKEADDERQADA